MLLLYVVIGFKLRKNKLWQSENVIEALRQCRFQAKRLLAKLYAIVGFKLSAYERSFTPSARSSLLITVLSGIPRPCS